MIYLVPGNVLQRGRVQRPVTPDLCEFNESPTFTILMLPKQEAMTQSHPRSFYTFRILQAYFNRYIPTCMSIRRQVSENFALN